MNETENQPPMTEWDKQTVTHLNDLVELDKAGKLEFFPIEQVFADAKKTIESIQAQQRAQRILTTYQTSHADYAI